MNAQFLRILKIMAAMICLLLSACADVSDLHEQPESAGQHIRNSINQPDKLSVNNSNAPSSYGALAPPELQPSLREISERRIEISPTITNSFLKGGRYAFPMVLEKNRFAVASLRGVDFFEYDSEKRELFPYLQIDTPGDAWYVEKVGPSLWVADGYAGVSVWNMITGEILATWAELEHARAFHTLHDGRVVVCRHRKGLDILSTTSNGVEINQRIHVDVGERVFFATSHGDRLFVGTLGAGYKAYDINKNSAEHRWTYTDCERIVWCAFQEGIHYILDQDKGLLILEDQGDRSPRFLSALSLPSQTRHACFVTREQIALANQKAIYLVDISLPGKPHIIQQVPAKLDIRGVVQLNDNELIVAESEYGVRLLQIDSDQIHDVSIFEQNGLVADVVSVNSTGVLVTNTGRGVALLRAETSNELSIVSQWRDIHYPVAADVKGSIAAIADYEGAVFLELDNNRIVRRLSRVKTPGRAVSICIEGNHAYVSDWFEGVQIVDIQNISEPIIQSTIATKGWAIDVAVKSNYAYVCSVTEGLLIVDISDPSHPLTIETDNSTQAPEAVAITDKALYVADFNFGLIVFDLKDPAKPLPAACFKLGVCKNLGIQNDLLIVSNYIYGVKWFDISQPLNPVMTGELDTPGKTYSVAFLPHENQILVADWHELLWVEW